MEYLRRFRPDLVPTEDELHAVRFDFDPAPALETLMLHFCGEIRLNHWYRRAAEWHTEPVIRRIYETLARDEARHGGAYLRYMKRAIESFGDEARARVREGRRADGQRPPHRAGRCIRPTCTSTPSCSRATPSRAACPTRSGSSTGSTTRSSSTAPGRTRSSTASCTTSACCSSAASPACRSSIATARRSARRWLPQRAPASGCRQPRPGLLRQRFERPLSDARSLQAFAAALSCSALRSATTFCALARSPTSFA